MLAAETTQKYSDSQPRVPAGSPEGGEFAAPDGPLRVPKFGPVTGYPDGPYNPNATYGPLTRDDKMYWVGASADDLRAIREHAGVPGTLGNKMLRLIDEAEPFHRVPGPGFQQVDGKWEPIPGTQPLVRGARIPKALDDVKKWSSRTTLDLGLTSFTTSEAEAKRYITGERVSGGALRPGDQAVFLTLEDGAKALRIGSTFGGTTTDEWVTAGQFKVVSPRGRITRLDDNTPVPQFTIRQVKTPSAALKYNPYHDEQGRFAEGASATLAARGVTVELEGVDPKHHEMIRSTVAGFLNRYPGVPPFGIRSDTDQGVGNLAVTTPPASQTFNETRVYLSPRYWDGSRPWARETQTPGFSVDPTPRGTVLHELGHVLDMSKNMYGSYAVAQRPYAEGGWESAYARHDNAERFAEAFVAYETKDPVWCFGDAQAMTSTLRRWAAEPEWAPDAQKFDPSQPRDDHGRWTADGESHALLGTTGVSHNWDPSLITVPAHWTDIAAARADLAARHEDTRFSPTLDRCDPKKVLPALAAYDVLATTFPGVAVQSVGSTWLKGEAAGAIAMTEVNTRDPRGSKIVLNEKVFGSDPFEGWGDKHGWTVAGTDNPQGTMFHEFGHAVIGQVAHNSRGAPITEAMRQFSTDEAKRSFADRASLSAYAGIGGGHEAAAEGFAAAYNPDSQASTHPIAVSVRTLVEDTGVGEKKDDVAFWDRYWGATQVAAQKFDPSQPRDEAGRWTAIPGGSEVAASAQRHLEALRGLSTARINAYVMDKTNTGVEVDRIDRERWREMAAQFVALHEAFPQVLISSIVMENSRKAWQPPGTIAWCTTDPWYNNADIHLSREIWHQTPRYSIPTDDNGWHVPGTSTPAAYMAHEFGHAVDNVATQATSRETVYPDTPLGWRGSGMYQHEQQVGGYAGAGGAKEVFAEIFGAVYSGHADALPAGAADGLHGYLTAAIGPHPVTKAAASPLVFMDAARRVLARGYADAYLAGHADTFTDEEDGSRLDDYDEPDPDFVDEQVAEVSDGAANRLVRLASLLVGGIVSARMLDSWLGGYAASAGSVYQQGFQNGVAAQGEIARAQWRTEEDGIVCQPCDDRDGQVWFGEEPHPYPGDGYYGEQCAGGPNCRCVLVYTIVPMSGADDDTVPPLLTDLAPFEDFSWEDLRKYSESQPRDERGRWAAAEAVRMAPSVRRGLEPDFQSESRHYPPTGPANGFTTHTRQYAAHQRLPAFTSTDIGAYDPAGTLVGTFSLAHGGAQDGYFKISVRPDAQRQGYGTRLLAEAERQGIDLTAVAGKNNYTPSGRALLVSYLGRDTVRKYSESQPRDEHGRWVNGDKAWRVRAALGGWMFDTRGTRAIRQALATGLREEPPVYTETRPGVWTRADSADPVTNLHAKILLDAVAEGAPAPRLYRGISFGYRTYDYHQLHGLKPGDALDLNLSSWTKNQHHADWMAGRAAHQVHFELEPGAAALAAGRYAPEDPEHEYLTDGRFTVTGVESYESPRPATISAPEGVNEHVNITLRQDAVFTQAEQALGLKYSANQPRDDQGRWTDAGGGPDPKVFEAGRQAWVGHWFDDDLNPRYVQDYHGEIRASLREAANYDPTQDPAVLAFRKAQDEWLVAYRAAPRTFAGSWDTIGSIPYSWYREHGQMPMPPVRDVTAPRASQQMREYGAALLEGIANTPATAPQLFRGLRLTNDEFLGITGLNRDDTIDLNLSSWTSERERAIGFASGDAGANTGAVRSASNPVVFVLDSGARAMDVGASPLPKEKEWLTNGRFTVSDLYDGPNNTVYVSLRQRGVFTSPDETVGLKYAESQPRDDHGRWTAGGGADEGYQRYVDAHDADLDYHRSQAELSGALHSWFQASKARMLRTALSEPSAVLVGYNDDPNTLHEQEDREARTDAARLLAEVNNAEPTDQMLFRGVALPPDAYPQFRQAFVPGSQVDLNLSAWTPDLTWAREFAGNNYGTVHHTAIDIDGIPLHPVVFELDRGARAFDAHNEAPEWQQYVHEHLTAGRFEVVSVEHGGSPVPWKDMTTDTVRLRQVATLEPPQLVGAKAESLLAAIEAELAARGVLYKYSPDQPRDFQGRWVAAGGPNPDPELHYLIAKWSDGYYDQYRTALATRGDWRYAIRVPGAVRLLEAANTAPPTRYPLYRGIGFNLQDHQGNPVDDPAHWEAFRAAVTPGAVVPMNLSSWTRDPSVARQFASNSFNTVGDNSMASTQVTFKVEPGARALDATYDIEQGPQYSEHLMAGLFEVTGVEEKVLRLTSTTLVTVGLRQVGLLDPETIVGAKVQKRDVSDEPRDDHGRWTASGGTYSDIAAAHMPDLTHDDLWDGVLTYQWSSDRVNSWLRGLDFPIAADRRLKKAMDAVMAKTVPLKHDLVVYRGEAGKDFVGDTARQVSRAATFDGTKGFTDKAYMSTTQDRDKAMFYAKADARDRGGRPFVVELHLPAGSRALPLDDAADLAGGGYWPGSGDSMYGFTRIFHVDSQEWVLPRGSSWEPKGMNGKMPVYELRP